MKPSRREFNRLAALSAGTVVVGIPIALVAATREPLEAPPRRGRANVVEEEGADPGEDRRPRDEEPQSEERRQRRSRRGREDRGDEGRGSATPPP